MTPTVHLRFLLLSVLLPFLVTSAWANTEKTIFLGPEPVNTRLTYSAISDLGLHPLTPANGTLRTALAAQFPSEDQPRGTATWLLLANLTPGQRYEVRVCWAATQPTAFWLDAFSLSTVQGSPDLLASLQAYAASHQPETPTAKDGTTEQAESSVLLLRILAAADYFTTDAELMSHVPPVDVDIILDPFLFNVLPRSLVGKVGYIVVVAVVVFGLAWNVVAWIQDLIANSKASQQEDEKKRQ